MFEEFFLCSKFICEVHFQCRWRQISSKLPITIYRYLRRKCGGDSISASLKSAAFCAKVIFVHKSKDASPGFGWESFCEIHKPKLKSQMAEDNAELLALQRIDETCTQLQQQVSHLPPRILPNTNTNTAELLCCCRELVIQRGGAPYPPVRPRSDPRISGILLRPTTLAESKSSSRPLLLPLPHRTFV